MRISIQWKTDLRSENSGGFRNPADVFQQEFTGGDSKKSPEMKKGTDSMSLETFF